jgi:hypothetical protein
MSRKNRYFHRVFRGKLVALLKVSMRKHLLVRLVTGLLAATAATTVMNAGGPSTAPSSARTVVVPSHVEWTNTRINVTRGQRLRFEATGEVRLSFDAADVAHPAGAVNSRHNGHAPVSAAPIGALIGRVGNGRPFSIGDSTNVLEMPAAGRLYLGVNDDYAGDNSGNFVVKVWEPAP